MLIIDEQIELFVIANGKGQLTEDVHKPIKDLLLEHPHTKFIIHNATKNIIIDEKLINIVRLVVSNLVIYARLEIGNDNKPTIKIFTIEDSVFSHYILKFEYPLGENKKILQTNVDELGKLLFTTNECCKCQFYAKDINLRCAVNPMVILNQELRCSDYEPLKTINKFPFRN
jgi:hypothetical protein